MRQYCLNTEVPLSSYWGTIVYSHLEHIVQPLGHYNLDTEAPGGTGLDTRFLRYWGAGLDTRFLRYWGNWLGHTFSAVPGELAWT